MTIEVCRYYEGDSLYTSYKCSHEKGRGMCPFVAAFGGKEGWIPVAEDLCKYYGEKKDEKYVLFLVRETLVYSSNNPFDYDISPPDKVIEEEQISSPMPLEELMVKCSSLMDDPVWKKYVKIKKV